ncbi:MarR family transcriptional regulator [Vibrio sp. SS-MA-C1-2]|uniref:MarR family winged helix-turn-helix transcriptional regulator n=1 Tax=Vibrio sp. SS-MA-C1-2 TaxID=2908646 RepID=UPI001F3DC6F3|nr:MarR family transcriptional regulator [Vibrio sp. SS-MA-C1-2]UJF16897.1 MarR family transcriptional regulator [Vibrio sp. SS-MA-C1-2]
MSHQNQESVEVILSMFKDNWPEIESEISPAIFRIVRVYQDLSQQLESSSEAQGLQRADFGVLSALRRSPKPYILTPTEISHSLLFSSGGLTKVLYRLEKLEYIQRLTNEVDKRSKLVQLTDSGKVLVERLLQQQLSYEQHYLSPLSKQEQQQLDGLLVKLIK